MRIPNSNHLEQPLRIHALVPDFVLEDVWALPVHGSAEEFGDALDLMTRAEPNGSLSGPARLLWRFRELFNGEPVARPIPGTDQTSLATRLPDDLVGTAAGTAFSSLPFHPVFRTADEFAAELTNLTVHAVMHLSWVPEGDGRYGGRMAVYVKPRGLFGRVYLGFIKPFRYLVVYPALMRSVERRWSARTGA